MNTLFWSIRRELWENRSVYLAPVIVAGVALVGFLISLVTLPARMRTALTLEPAAMRAAIEQPYVIAALILMAVELFVAIFYCLDALYGERRDRSVLFWKSLPVSDRTAVLAKASIPIVVLPVVTFVATVAVQAVMLLFSTAVLAGNGLSAAPLWAEVSLLDIAGVNFVHLVALHGIWYAPLYAWLLLASAWATRLPFLWAVLPPVALGVLERIAFNSARFAMLVQAHFLGGPEGNPTGSEPAMTMDMLTPHSAAHFFGAPALWIGLALTVVFLLGAVRLRRLRGVI